MESTVVRWTAALIILFYSNSALSQSYIPDPDCKNHPQLVSVPFVSKPGYCTWHGQCVYNKATKAMFNCYYNGPAKDVTHDKDFLKLLNETCPWYVGKDGAETKVCCDKDQVNELKKQTKTAQSLFSRCPACLQNFMKHFCFTTCNPDMSLYMDPFSKMYNTIQTTKKCELKNGTNVTYLESVNVYVDQNYGDRLFNSCSNVEFPEQSGKVISLMCGDAEKCNAEAWLKFLGDPGLDYDEAPFLMEYTFTNSSTAIKPNMSGFDTNLTKCDDEGSLQCSCSDCPTHKVCPALVPPVPPSHLFHYIMFGIAGFFFLMTLTCFFVTFISSVMCHKADNEEDSTDISSSSSGSVNDDIVTEQEMQTDPLCGACDWLYSRVGRPLVQIGNWMEFVIKSLFYYWGLAASLGWFIVLPLSLLVFGGLSVGILKFQVTTDPVQLWSSPTSQARIEKDYFDHNFGPFYRTEQIIIRPKPFVRSFNMTIRSMTQEILFGPVFTKEVLTEVFYLQNHISNIVGTRDDGSNVTLNDICFKPLSPDNNNCTIESVINYFQNNFTRLSYYEGDDFGLQNVNATSHINYCTGNPTATKGKYAQYPEGQFGCMGEFGGPIDPNTALGGFPTENGVNRYNNATALMITFVVNNHVNDELNKDAKAWEYEYLKFLKKYEGKYIQISFTAERAITDEINRESSADEITILISYVVMFLYIAVFMGSARGVLTILIDWKIAVGLRTMFVDLKIVLGICGVLIVLLAVAGSVGFMSLFGIEGSLIILEVVPFLVLAVGVDNLFILVHSYQRQLKAHATLDTHQIVARALAEVAPSLILTATAESAAFLLGAISTMPAVRTFSLYAGVAVFFNFLLQISAFVSVMYLDAWRSKNNSVDVFWFIRFPKDAISTRRREPVLTWLMRKFFSSFILHRFIRPFILLLFGTTLSLSLATFPFLEVGLDQNLALPKDSYLQNYFHDMYKYLHIGAPVYFVIEDGVNYTTFADQDKICSGSFCNKDSVGTQIAVAARSANITRIAEPGSIWLDSYYEWLDPSGSCCGYEKDDKNKICTNPSDDANSTCLHCLKQSDKRPSPEQFLKYLKPFLEANPNIDCAAAGHAAYNSAVKFDSQGKINTSYIMTYHSISRTSSDFISALKQARKLSTNLTKTVGVEIFPYSVFYVYYEQYLYTYHDMILNIGLSIAAVFCVTTAMMGLNVWGALMVIITVVMIIVHLIAVMALIGINANAVSLVNLVMTVGIAVEFSAHIVRWFISSKEKNRVERARSAISHMGSSVVSGITITKFLGVFILAFAKSQLFFVYYFGMYFSMVILGCLHGLFFLPVFLSFFGPPYVPVRIRSPYPKDPSETRDPPRAPVSSETFGDKKRLEDEEYKGSVNTPPINDRIYPVVLPSDQPQDYGAPTYPRNDDVNATERTPLLS